MISHSNLPNMLTDIQGRQTSPIKTAKNHERKRIEVINHYTRLLIVLSKETRKHVDNQMWMNFSFFFIIDV